MMLTAAQSQPVPKPESARYWAEKGGQLMANGRFSSAYSAFQLARSLGASGMVPRMEEARRRNLNHILLQSLLVEARALTDSDPAQAMRLLEHARRHFPDSSRILQEVGTLTNRPNFWPFTLKAAQLWSSPTLRYVVAAGNPAQLYACRGDSLTLLHTFTAPVENVFFAPGDRLAWVATPTGTLLLDCQPTAVRVVSQLPDVMQRAVCSPDGRYMLASFANDGVNRLYRIRKGSLEKTDVAANPKQSIFSPDGRFLCLLATEGLTTVRQLYHLTADGPQLVRDSRAQPSLSDAAFSPDGRWLLMEGKARNTVELARLDPDSVRSRLFSGCYADRLTEAFSADGRWLLLSFFKSAQDSLWAMTANGPQFRHVFASDSEANASTYRLRVLSRFSPEGSWLLRSSPTDRAEAQCWNLRGPSPRLVHRFTQKEWVQYDEFSADGRYLLARHRSTDSLWQCSDVGLRPVHGFRNALRLTDTPNTRSSIHPAFSPDSRLLISYHSGGTPDSLWQIGAGKLNPLHGFREQLSAEFTFFSSGGQWLLTGGNALTDKALFGTALLGSLHQPQVQASLLEARFSEGGQYLFGRSVASDSATVLYRAQGGQLRLLQKLKERFWMSESRFLKQDRFLFTYHEAQNGQQSSQPINQIWRIANDGLTPVYRFREPYVRAVVRPGQIRPIMVYRNLLVAPDGQHLFTHTGNKRADSLWQLTETGVMPMRPVDPTATGLFSFNTSQDSVQVPGAGFIGGYFWQTRTMGERVTLQPIDLATKPTYALPEGTDHLFGFSPRTGLAVFAPRIFEGPVLHVYRGGQWRPIRQFPGGKYDYQEGKKPGEPSPNVLSPDGRLLFIKTADRLWVYRLNGTTVSLLHDQAGVFRQYAFAPVDADGTNSNGLVFSDLKQTFWLYLRASGSRVNRIGDGTLERPPAYRNGLLYVTRRLADEQVAVDALDPATGLRLAQTVVRQFLDLTLRPDGTVWIITTGGVRVLYPPLGRLNWLRRSGLPGLAKELVGKYAFEP